MWEQGTFAPTFLPPHKGSYLLNYLDKRKITLSLILNFHAIVHIYTCTPAQDNIFKMS